MEIIISRNSFEYLNNECPHCLEYFLKDDTVLLLIHIINGKSEGVKQAKKTCHIFHEDCIKDKYSICPLDRYKIYSTKKFKYNELIIINLIGYSTDYYQFLDNKPASISLLNINNINYLDNNGKTLLYCACQRNDEYLIAKLIKFGANVNIGDDNHFTPLMILTCLNHFNSIKKFNPGNTDVNAIDSTGKTALDYAVEYSHFNILDYLIRNFNISHENLRKIYTCVKYIKGKDSITDELLSSVKSKINELVSLNSQDEFKLSDLGLKFKFKPPEISIYHPIHYIEKPLKIYEDMYKPFSSNSH